MHLPRSFRSLLASVLSMTAILTASAAAQDLSPAGKEALDKFQQNDVQGAIALLEPARGRGELTPVDASLLGTLYLEGGRAVDALGILRPMADDAAADAAVLYNTGRAALLAGEVQSAMVYLQRSVNKMPVSPAARELGLLYGRQGRNAEALRLLRPWVERYPNDLEVRTAAAALALKLQRPSDAEPLLAPLPKTPSNDLLRAQMALQRSQPEDALSYLEPLLPNHPPAMRIDLLRLTADAYINAGRAQDAVTLLDNWDLDSEDKDVRLILLLAEARYRTGDVEAAVERLTPVASPLLERELSHPLALQTALDYSRMLIAAGRHSDALPYLERATKAAPDDQLAWKAYGDALLGAGRRDEAQEAMARFQTLADRSTELRRQKELAAQDPTAVKLLAAQSSLKAGDAAGALDLLRQEISLSPQDLRPRVLEVRALVQIGRMQEALQAAERTLESFPDHPDAIYQRGAVRLGLNQRQAAEKDLRRTLQIRPDHVAAMSDLAVLLMTQARNDEAKGLLEKVLELQPENPVAAKHLERLSNGR